MEHVKDTEWHEYLADNCPPERVSWIKQHLDQCDSCRNQMHKYRNLYDILGHWQVDTSRYAVSNKVIRFATKRNIQFSDILKQTKFRQILVWTSQIAAAILIGISLGHVAGRMSAKEHIAQQNGETVFAKPGYLAALDLQFASDLTWSVLEDIQTELENQE